MKLHVYEMSWSRTNDIPVFVRGIGRNLENDNLRRSLGRVKAQTLCYVVSTVEAEPRPSPVHSVRSRQRGTPASSSCPTARTSIPSESVFCVSRLQEGPETHHSAQWDHLTLPRHSLELSDPELLPGQWS